MKSSALVVICYLGVTGSAVAADMSDVVAELLKQQNKVALMSVEATKLENQNAELVRRAATVKKEEKRITTEQQRFVAENAANETKKAEAIQSGCRPGQSTTDLALARRCNELAKIINDKTNELQARGETLLANNAQVQRQREQLSKDTLSWTGNKKRLNAAMADLNNRISALKNYINAHCSSLPTNATEEEVKLKCGNVQFDGAAPTLPPCETIECREAEGRY
jgi:hypothetical protein